MSASRQLLAITDFGMTGLDARRHEIIEIGLIVADAVSFEVVDLLDIKVRPEHIETASPEALQVNGYSKEAWLDAVTLPSAWGQYANKTAGALFVAHNLFVDWSFAQAAFEKTDIWNRIEYPKIDALSVAWGSLSQKGLQNFDLKSVAEFLRLAPEPIPHRAINGAWTTYNVLKKLMHA